MDPFEYKQKKKDELEAGNLRSYNELRQKLGPRWSGMDTSDLRRELFMEFLVQWGVITAEQMLDYDFAFHKKVEEALDGMWKQVREAEGKSKLTVVKNPVKLLDDKGRPIG
jgi:hypothetical protein